MGPEDKLPPIYIQQNEQATLEKAQQNFVESAKILNDVGGEYRKVTADADDKIIFLAAGSISLLLTFLGILFNGHKNVASLHFKFVALSSLFFILTITFLLITKRLWSLYLYTDVHSQYLKSLKNKHESELRLMKSGVGFVNAESYENMSAEEINKQVSKGENYLKLVEKQRQKDRENTKIFFWSAHATSFSGYTCFILGYIFALIFFLGVIKIMNGI